MDTSQLAADNRILQIRFGSHLYGTQRPESDEDFVGVFMPNKRIVYGFLRVDEVDNSIHAKDENNKNTSDAKDIKYYEFRKYIKLLMENNPNILETIFVNRENIIFVNDWGRHILDNRHLFPHQGLKQKFLGYAFSQKHKMFIKKDNYFNLIKAKDYLSRFNIGWSLWEAEKDMDKSVFIKRLNQKSGSIDYYNVGDINLLPSLTIKNAIKYIDERLGKVGNREELYLKHAYDTKFASHLVRLMYEGIELLQTGELQFPLRERDTIISIRQGSWAIEDVIDLSNKLESEIETIETRLPAKPRFEEIEMMTMEMVEQFLSCK